MNDSFMEEVNVNREDVVDIEKQDWDEDGKRQREYKEPEMFEVVGVPNFEATKEKPIG